MKIAFFAQTLLELKDQLNDFSSKLPYQLYNWHMKQGRIEQCSNSIAKKAQEFIAAHYDFSLPQIKETHLSQDKTVKFSLELKDGLLIEAVLLPFKEKYSLCLSSQVGCAMNCSFCFTGKQGFKRNLSTEEIIGQYIVVRNWLKMNRPDEAKLTNVVFMGQGEPLQNFDMVKQACKILLEQAGISLAPHKITISTAGYLPGLLRFKAEMPNVNIAVSLHSTLKEIRDELIPLNKKYDIQEVAKIAEAIPEGKNRFVTYEYMLIQDKNDSAEHAYITAEFLKNKNVYVSLIPFNPFPTSEYKKPTMERVEAFKKILEEFKIPTIIRKTKGDEILAACGQLNSQFNLCS